MMVSEREIDALLQEIESTGRVVEAETVSPDAGQMTARDADGLVTGDILPGGTAEATLSLAVAGGILGDEGSPARLHAGERIVVRGDAAHANVSAAHVTIDGNVEQSRLTVSRGAKVGGRLRATRVVLGEFQDMQQRLDHLAQLVERRQEERETQRGQVKFASRKVLKESRNTQVDFDLNLGSILLVRHRGVEVDLSPLYRILDSRGESARDDVVEEFFDRVIVGSLTKANRGYIAKNRGRQAVFLRVLRELRALVQMVRSFDAIDEVIESAHKEREEILEQARHGGELKLEVGGGVSAGVEVDFVTARIEENEEGDGTPTVKRADARVRFSEAVDGGLLAQLHAPDGSSREMVLPASCLELSLELRDSELSLTGPGIEATEPAGSADGDGAATAADADPVTAADSEATPETDDSAAAVAA